MTRSKLNLTHKFLPVFRMGISLVILTMAASVLVWADEGTAASEGSPKASQSVVPSASSDSNDSASTGTSHWWNRLPDTNLGGFKPRIRPHFYADNSYNSNSTLTRKGRGAWQARVSPGITVDLPFNDKLYSSIDYTYSFATTQGPNVSSHSNTHNIDVITRYDLSKKTALGVRNNTQWSDVPGAPGNQFFLETVSPEIKHNFGSKLSTGLNYVFQHFRDTTESASGGSSDFFRGGVSNDTFNDHHIKANAEYKAGSNLSVGPGFGWSVRNFTKANAKDYWQITPELAGSYTFTPKTKLGAHFGWSYRRFDTGDAYDDAFIYGATVTHLLSKKFIWDVNYEHSLQDTFDTSFVFRQSNSQAVILDNYDRHFRSIHNHRIGTTLTYNVNEKNSAGIFGGFQASNAESNQNVFSNDRMEEKMLDVGASYLYRLTRYISLQLAYEFGRSFQAKDNPSRSLFTFHKVTAGVNVAF